MFCLKSTMKAQSQCPFVSSECVNVLNCQILVVCDPGQLFFIIVSERARHYQV